VANSNFCPSLDQQSLFSIGVLTTHCDRVTNPVFLVFGNVDNFALVACNSACQGFFKVSAGLLHHQLVKGFFCCPYKIGI